MEQHQAVVVQFPTITGHPRGKCRKVRHRNIKVGCADSVTFHLTASFFTFYKKGMGRLA